MYDSLVGVNYVDEALNLVELDAGDEDETNNEENERRNYPNKGYDMSNFDDVEEFGGTKFGYS